MKKTFALFVLLLFVFLISSQGVHAQDVQSYSLNLPRHFTLFTSSLVRSVESSWSRLESFFKKEGDTAPFSQLKASLVFVNKPPTILRAAWSPIIKKGDTLQLDTTTYDREGDPYSIAVDWGDDQYSFANANRMPIGRALATPFRHPYTTEGRFPVLIATASSTNGSTFPQGVYVSTTRWVNVLPVDCKKQERVRRDPLHTTEFESLGLDASQYPEIIRYRIQSDTGSWSIWYRPGVRDEDSVKNADGSMRRKWASFADHVHEIIVCARRS